MTPTASSPRPRTKTTSLPKRLSLAVAVLASSLALAGCATTATPTTKAPLSTDTPSQTAKLSQDVYDVTLANGLRVLIKQDARAPVVMTQIWYDVGSNDEPVGKGGISHLLEHMMFKDAKGVSHSDFQRLISHFGGQLNAFTSNDYTAYYESLPANQFPLALQIEANRMANLILKPDEFITEKAVVKEERRLRTDDNPDARAYEQFARLAQPHSPQGRPIIGSMADIDNLTPEDLQQWYRKWYVPNNATLVLVGDITPDTAMPWVERYFSALKPSALPKRAALTHPTHQGYQHKVIKEEVEVPSLMLGFNVPVLKTAKDPKDAYALTLLADVADGGLSARFEKSLIREQDLLSHVALSYDLLGKADSVLTIDATPREGVDLQTAENAILAELAKISAVSISDDEIKRGQVGTMAGLVFGNDSIADQAILLGSLSTNGLPIDTFNTLPKALAAVTKADIERVNKKYLVRDNLTSVHVLPKSSQAQPKS